MPVRNVAAVEHMLQGGDLPFVSVQIFARSLTYCVLAALFLNDAPSIVHLSFPSPKRHVARKFAKICIPQLAIFPSIMPLQMAIMQ